jgi:hypothetical protein
LGLADRGLVHLPGKSSSSSGAKEYRIDYLLSPAVIDNIPLGELLYLLNQIIERQPEEKK